MGRVMRVTTVVKCTVGLHPHHCAAMPSLTPSHSQMEPISSGVDFTDM